MLNPMPNLYTGAPYPISADDILSFPLVPNVGTLNLTTTSYSNYLSGGDEGVINGAERARGIHLP